MVSTPLSFDATLTSLLAPLLSGARVILLPEGTAMLKALWQALFESSEPRLFKLTPAHLQGLEYESTAAHAVRWRIGWWWAASSGRRQVLRRWKQQYLPHAIFVNEYGLTETVVGCSIYEVRTPEQLQALDDTAAVPIGRPIATTQLYVLGEAGQLQPAGAAGELYIGGAGVSSGYSEPSGAMQQKFVANPYGEGQLYRSGDRVRWLPHGELEFIGRTSNT